MIRKFVLLLAIGGAAAFGAHKLGWVPGLSRLIHPEPAVEVVSPVVASADPEPSAPQPPAVPAPAPVQQKAEHSTRGSVMVLCYHRFENRPKDSLAIQPEEFERQLGELQKAGFSVIPMADFLAWRRGEKDIPEKSCVISIDDGYRSGYEVAWPILKKFGYPFTMFVYTHYMKGQRMAGGQSMSWEELAQMRDAGVDIESHTVSHSDFRAAKRGRTPEQYEKWLRDELAGSKKLIEQKLGILVKCVAYPYGNHNAEARKVAIEAGYEAAFTVYGQRLSYHSPADMLGRYAVEGTKPQIFQSALKMIGGGVSADEGSVVGHAAASSMLTQPMEGEVVTEARPVIKANVATLGAVDPASIEMRISGVGMVPVKFDAENKLVEAVLKEDLREPNYTVILSAKVGGRKIETRWSFSYQKEGAAPPPAPATPVAPTAPAGASVKGKKPKS